MDNTITEYDMDATSQQFVQALRFENVEIENDLDVDGLSESLMSRLYSLFTSSRKN